MSIYVIFTGGTIGSFNVNNVINTDSSVSKYFISVYKEKYSVDESFKCSNPYTILSENLNAEYIMQLINEIKSVLNNNDVEGIIINHGTDTLQYTSAVLAYVFSDIKVPLVVVSSNHVITDVRSNGLINFHYAVRFIKENKRCGVFVSYKNDNDIPYIHVGTKLTAPLLFSADVSGAGDSWFARYENDKIVFNNKYYNLTNENKLSYLHDDLSIYKLSDNEIMWIKPYPGMSYLLPSKDTKAVLHESFHSGTIAINDDLICFADACKRMEIPIYITGLSANEAVYETVNEYIKLGFIPLYGCTPISVYCKIWISVCNNLDISETIKKCVSFDMI